jgi:hypothetical protein
MKNIVLTLLLLAAHTLYAQGENDSPITEETTSGDTTIVRLGNHQLKIVEREGKDEVLLEKKEDDKWITQREWSSNEEDDSCEKDGMSEWSRRHQLTHWSGIYMGMNGFVGPNQALDLPEESNQLQLDYGKSFSFAVNFPEVKLKLVKDYVGIYTGLGYQFNSYRLRQNTNVTFGEQMTFARDTVRNLTRNTIQVGYIRVPLMLEFNTSSKPSNSVHIAAGVVGGIRLHSTYIQDHNADGVDYVTRVEGIPNLNVLTAEAMLRVGYGPLVLYASYGLTPMFTLKEGPELYPINAGIGFAF